MHVWFTHAWIYTQYAFASRAWVCMRTTSNLKRKNLIHACLLLEGQIQFQSQVAGVQTTTRLRTETTTLNRQNWVGWYSCIGMCIEYLLPNAYLIASISLLYLVGAQRISQSVKIFYCQFGASSWRLFSTLEHAFEALQGHRAGWKVQGVFRDAKRRHCLRPSTYGGELHSENQSKLPSTLPLETWKGTSSSAWSDLLWQTTR